MLVWIYDGSAQPAVVPMTPAQQAHYRESVHHFTPEIVDGWGEINLIYFGF
jgi:hypothetical protein